MIPPMTEPLTPEEEATFRDMIEHPVGDGMTGLYEVSRLVATLDAERKRLFLLGAEAQQEAVDILAASVPLREAVAKAIYDAMRENDPEGRTKPWVRDGNSPKQNEARSRAAAALASAPEDSEELR